MAQICSLIILHITVFQYVLITCSNCKDFNFDGILADGNGSEINLPTKIMKKNVKVFIFKDFLVFSVKKNLQFFQPALLKQGRMRDMRRRAPYRSRWQVFFRVLFSLRPQQMTFLRESLSHI